MFLIEYSKGTFLDGERVETVLVHKDSIKVWLTGTECEFVVEKGYEVLFLNNLESLDENNQPLTEMWLDINKQGKM